MSSCCCDGSVGVAPLPVVVVAIVVAAAAVVVVVVGFPSLLPLLPWSSSLFSPLLAPLPICHVLFVVLVALLC